MKRLANFLNGLSLSTRAIVYCSCTLAAEMLPNLVPHVDGLFASFWKLGCVLVYGRWVLKHLGKVPT